MPSGWLLLAAALLTGYVAAGAALWAFQEKLLFFPRPVDPADAKRLASYEVSTSAADGTHLSGWALPGNPGSNKPVIIYFGGNGEEISGSLEELSERLHLPAGGLNYRGYGASEGKPTAEHLRNDAVAAFDAVLNRFGAVEEEAVIVGRSLGSHMAAVVAGRRDVAGLILVTPFDSVRAVAARRYPIFPTGALLRHDFDNIAESARIRAPVLIIGAGRDGIVPIAHTNALAASWGGTNEMANAVLPDATHNDVSWHDDYWQMLDAFVGRVWPSQQQN